MEIKIDNVNDAQFISIVNMSGMKTILSTCGAGIVDILIDEVPMTMSEMGYAQWAEAPTFAGKTVGRIAGRIKNGKMKYNGKKYDLYHNENGKTCHHGGTRHFSFDNHPYQIFVEEDKIIVEFTIKDDESKFPGKIEVKVRYLVFKDENIVRIEYATTADEKTPVNLTNHTYFSLGENSLDSLSMKLNAESVAKYDKNLIQKKMRKLPRYLDFTEEKAFSKKVWKARELRKRRLLGIDHAYKLANCDNNEANLVLKSAKFELDVLTSLPAIHVYTSNFIHEGALMNNGKVAEEHNSLAIEPQYIAGDYASMTVEPNQPKCDYIQYNFKRI